MSCVSCGESVHGPSRFCPACGHPQQTAVAVLEPVPESPTTNTVTASDRHAITGRLIAATALYFLLPCVVSTLITGIIVGTVVCAVLELAGLALVSATSARRAGAGALALLTAFAWMGLNDHWPYEAQHVAVAVLFTVQFVAWLVGTRRRGLPYVLVVVALVLSFLLGGQIAMPGLYALSGRQWLAWSVVGGLLWAVLGLIAAWMPTPERRPETAGGTVPAGEAPSASSETSTLAVVAFLASFVVSVAGVVLGHMALGEIRRTGKRGHGLAVAALVIGYGAIALILTAVLALMAGSGVGS